jgi:hypothetical protein
MLAAEPEHSHSLLFSKMPFLTQYAVFLADNGKTPETLNVPTTEIHVSHLNYITFHFLRKLTTTLGLILWSNLQAILALTFNMDSDHFPVIFVAGAKNVSLHTYNLEGPDQLILQQHK